MDYGNIRSEFSFLLNFEKKYLFKKTLFARNIYIDAIYLAPIYILNYWLRQITANLGLLK